MKIKILGYDMGENLTSNQIDLIDKINKDPLIVIDSKSSYELADNLYVSYSALIAFIKKLNFESYDLFKKFIKDKYKLNYSDDKYFIDENHLLESSLKFLDDTKLVFKNIDWENIKHFINEFKKIKYVFTLNEIGSFEFRSFNILCNMLNISLFRMNSNHLFNMTKKLFIKDNAILIISTFSGNFCEFEKSVIDWAIESKINIYYFSGNDTNINNDFYKIVIGNFFDNQQKYNNLLHFKNYYNTLIEFVLSILFNVYVK